MRIRLGDWTVGDKYWKKSHKAFYCEVTKPDGRRDQRKLDADAEQAEVKRAAVISAIRDEGAPSPEYKVRNLCYLFLDWLKANRADKTYVWYFRYLNSFANSIPLTLTIKELKRSHVENWLTRVFPAKPTNKKGERKKGQNTRRGAVVAVKRVFSWAIEMEYIAASPLTGLKAPAAVPRKDFLTREQWQVVLGHYETDDPFREFLEFSLYTGCRPQETRIITALHADFPGKKVRLLDGEIPGKEGNREIPLIDEAIVILRKAALKHPDGPVFRNEDGNPWTPTALNSRFTRLRKKIPFRAFSYLTRHSAATNMLENGASAGAVAKILGHKDATMVLQTYGAHIDRCDQHLLDCLKKADPLGKSAG